ncbi:MAG: laccase domain-containing protein, partial [Gemmatimonadetes bacterium]|nr:laccase domain-containing protein [Gemmatimonadota bacterium]
MTTNLGAAARLVSRGEGQWFRAPALAIHPEIEHGVTHASLGNFSKTTDPSPEDVDERRKRLLRAAQLSFARVIAPHLHHSANVAVVRDGVLPEGKWDGVVTDDVRMVLAVTVADCVPVFFVDAEGGAFGVVHAGWRGMAGGIVRTA